MKFDELNRLFKDYYEPMAISADDKERRRELADLLTDAFLYFFSVFEVHSQYNKLLEKALYEKLLADRISDAVSKITGIDGYISDHIRTLAKEVVNTTYKNVDVDNSELSRQSPQPSADNTALQGPSGSPFNNNYKPSISTDGPNLKEEREKGDNNNSGNGNGNYWLSFDRASNIAFSEANTFLNYTDYLDAKERGYTRKTWLTMFDQKVRDTHEEVEGQTVGIDEFFTVGNSLMKFPHDLSESPDPKEIINCRCAVEYK